MPLTTAPNAEPSTATPEPGPQNPAPSLTGSEPGTKNAEPSMMNLELRTKNDERGTKNEDHLSPQEQQLLGECESVLRQDKASFMAVGRALTRIREARLYRQDFRTFAAYCHQKWVLGKSQVYRLIAATELVAYLSPIGDIVPDHESQVRWLIGLTKEQAALAWQKAVTSATGKTVTAKLVKVAAAEFRPKKILAALNALAQNRSLSPNASPRSSIICTNCSAWSNTASRNSITMSIS